MADRDPTLEPVWTEGGTPPAPAAVEVYSSRAVGYATFFGGPMAGCWFLSRNYLALGEPANASKALWYGAAGTAAMCAIMFFVPAISDTPARSIIPIAYSVGIGRYVRQSQTPRITEGIAKGSLRKGSGWKVFGLSIAWCLGTIAVIFGLVFVMVLAGVPMPNPDTK